MAQVIPNFQSAAVPLDGPRNITQTTPQRIIPNVDPKILFRLPNATPVVTLTKGIKGSKTVDNRVFGWLFKDKYPRHSSVAGAIDDNDVTLNVTAGSGVRFFPNAEVLNSATGEVFRVASVATDALTIVRLSNASAMAVDQPLFIIGSAHKDGGATSALKSTDSVYDYNNCQIVRSAWGYTRRQSKTGLFGGKDPKLLKQEKTTEHALDLEYIAIFGRRHVEIVDGVEITYAGGILEFVEPVSSVDFENSAPTFDEFNQILEWAMAEGDGGYANRKGDASKYLVHSPAYGTLFDKWWGDRIQYRPADTNLGLKIGFVNTSHGRLGLMRHPLLMGAFGDRALLLDFNHLTSVTFSGGDTTLSENIEVPGTDGSVHEYLTDWSLQIENARAHTSFKGLPKSV